MLLEHEDLGDVAAPGIFDVLATFTPTSSAPSRRELAQRLEARVIETDRIRWGFHPKAWRFESNERGEIHAAWVARESEIVLPTHADSEAA